MCGCVFVCVCVQYLRMRIPPMYKATISILNYYTYIINFYNSIIYIVYNLLYK